MMEKELYVQPVTTYLEFGSTFLIWVKRENNLIYFSFSQFPLYNYKILSEYKHFTS